MRYLTRFNNFKGVVLTSKRKQEWEKNQIGPKEALKEMKSLRYYVDGEKRILNLTPHPIHIIGTDGNDIYIPKSGAELRISTRENIEIDLGFSTIYTHLPNYNRLNIFFKRQGKKNLLGRLPLPSHLNRDMPNTYLLTSRVAAHQLEEYERILIVGIAGQKSNQPYLCLSRDY